MAGDDTEEKKHAPSAKKLRNLRDNEGQIPKSQDVPVTFSLLFVLAYLIMDFRGIMGRFSDLFNVVFQASGLNFATQFGLILPAMGILLAALVLPAMGVAVLTTIAATLFNTRGLVINKKAVAPNFTKLNPVQGFKNMFKLQTLMDLIKGLIKMVLFAIAVIYVGKMAIPSLMIAPACGQECVVSAAQKIFMYIIIICAFILLLGAVLDIPLSTWLFKRDQKMSDTEVKREQKEEMGDPQIRSARRQRHRQLIEGGPVGIDKANMLIIGEGVAIGISYIRGETPAPVTVAKGTGAKAAEFFNYARGVGMYIYQDNELAAELIGRSPMGDFIPRSFFMPVAKALVEADLV